jgi:threonine/homoserine/homoserine lactone efflux protein
LLSTQGVREIGEGKEMTDLLPAWPLLTAFLAASFVLAVTPGPGVLYIVTRSITQGRRAGLASVAGVALGNLGNAIGASLGLAVLFALSSLAFSIVKYAGAAYLIYLGIQALRAPPSTSTTPRLSTQPLLRIVRDGFVVALLNPKTALFFAAFLPQFMNSNANPMQSITLGVIFVAIAAITDSIYALTASSVAPRLTKAMTFKSLGRYVSGGVFIGLGVLTAIGSSRASK